MIFYILETTGEYLTDIKVVGIATTKKGAIKIRDKWKDEWINAIYEIVEVLNE